MYNSDECDPDRRQKKQKSTDTQMIFTYVRVVLVSKVTADPCDNFKYFLQE